MNPRLRSFSGVNGRRIIFALGGFYVVAAALWPFVPTVDADSGTINEILTVSTLLVSPGLVLLYGGYRLPRTDIRPELFSVVAKWCFGGIGVILGVLLFIALAADLSNPIVNGLVLTGLASVAGLGMGYHDARAKTRALNAEKRRQESERYSRELERYETIVETVNDGIYVVNDDRQFTLVNDAYAELVGYDREELLGSDTSLVAEEADALAEEIHRDLTTDGKSKTYEATLVTKTGEKVEAEATVALLPEQGDGERDRVSVVRDMTERNERGRRLEQQNKRLDSFASMVAHELRNPLMIGQMYCHELPTDASPTAVSYITEAFDRIEDIIDVILVVTQGYEAVPESSPVDLATTIDAAWDKIDASDANLEVLIDGTIQADETYVQHLFRNLFENAVEHGGSDVTVTVGELPTGFYVADDGNGIPEDDRDTVFEMGYTTAGNYGGMGLGLSFVYELATVYGWECAVTESDAGGAQFEFTNVAETPRVVE